MAAMETLVLMGASVIDGTGAPPVRGRAVVVEGGRIASVVDEASAPRGRRTDLSGCTLLPGLINCHVHLCLGAEADPVRVLKDEPAEQIGALGDGCLVMARGAVVTAP